MDKLALNADSDSVDFSFFDAEGNSSKNCGNKYSSKIITRAVIEAEPREVSKIIQNNITLKTLKVNAATNKVNFVQNMINDSVTSPTSSEEKRILGNSIEDLTLFNCLAFNDDGNDQPISNVDDKYFSDNSLSDSTITTVTSDFTTVSHLSAMSDTSCGSDLSTDSTTPQNCDSVTNNVRNLTENTEESSNESNERYFKMRDDSSTPVKPNEFDHSIEWNNHEDEHYRHDNDFEDQENNSSSDRDSDINSNKIDSPKTSFDIERGSLDNIENSNENQELSYNSLSRKESNLSMIEDKLGDISLASRSSSTSNLAKSHYCRVQNKFKSKKKELNLTFSREELIKIERDNTILLRKIMSYSKPKSVSLNHMFSHKKTSAAINRARQQKRIEQDNYILYSKINAMSRMKKVF